MLVYSVAGQNTGLWFTLCLWVRGTYVTYMHEAAVVVGGREGGTVRELAFVPLETYWMASECVS